MHARSVIQSHQRGLVCECFYQVRCAAEVLALLVLVVLVLVLVVLVLMVLVVLVVLVLVLVLMVLMVLVVLVVVLVVVVLVLVALLLLLLVVVLLLLVVVLLLVQVMLLLLFTKQLSIPDESWNSRLFSSFLCRLTEALLPVAAGSQNARRANCMVGTPSDRSSLSSSLGVSCVSILIPTRHLSTSCFGNRKHRGDVQSARRELRNQRDEM